VNNNTLLWRKPPGSDELWVGNGAATSTGITLQPKHDPALGGAQ
jgi:hypothetical protein